MRIVVIGGGGAGREVLDVIDAIKTAGTQHLEVVGVLDDGEPDTSKLTAYEVEHLGPIAKLAGLASDVGYVIGIGTPGARERIDLLGGGRECPVVVHPTAVLAREVRLGPGTVVAAHATFMNHVTCGRHVHVSVGCSIGHDVMLEDYVEVSPATALSGFVTVGRGAFFGTGARVNPGLDVKAGAVVGAGAAVVRNVPAGTTVVGVPARPIADSRQTTTGPRSRVT